jgi:Arc/MetJ family transcription regulator
VYTAGVARTNIVLDEQLIRQAMKLTGARTKREAVDIALRAIVARSSAQQALLRLRGKLPWQGDPIALRRAGR